MNSYNTDDTYNNDEFSTAGHDSHEIEISSSEDGQFVVVHVDEPSSHDVTSSTDPMGVNKVNVITESPHTHQDSEIPSDVETTGFQNQLSNILYPNGHATASSAIDSESGYNETLKEIKDQSIEQDNNVQKTVSSKVDKSQIPFRGCTGCATKCLHTCSGACFTSCSGSCDGSSSGR